MEKLTWIWKRLPVISLFYYLQGEFTNDGSSGNLFFAIINVLWMILGMGLVLMSFGQIK